MRRACTSLVVPAGFRIIICLGLGIVSVSHCSTMSAYATTTGGRVVVFKIKNGKWDLLVLSNDL